MKINITMNHIKMKQKKIIINLAWHISSEIKKYFLEKDTSIIWNRHYGYDAPNCEEGEKVTKTLNVGSMIVGHTVQDKINSKCDSKLWRVDVGLSSIFDNENNISDFRTMPCFARFIYPAVAYDGYLSHCSQSGAIRFRDMSLGNLQNNNFWDLFSLNPKKS